jgi:translocation and assembly module TamB
LLRKILVSLAVLLLVVVGLLAVAFGLAQTQIAKAQITGLVEDSLTSGSQTAEVAELEGILPFDVRLGRFRLADDTGTWLEVDNARVRVSPSRLLAGEVRVEEVGAARIAVHRTPDLPEAPEPEPSDEPFSLPDAPSLPESLPRVVVERLFVDRIELGEALIGENAVFTLDGSATTGPEGRRAEARLDLDRIDQETASLGLSAVLDLEAESIGLELAGSETGGLMAALIGQPEAGDLSLNLTGDGPLADWRADLRFAIDNLVSANADLALAYAENPSIDLTLNVQPVAGALPADIEAVLGDRLELALAGGQRAPGHFALDRLTLESGIATATGSLEAQVDQDRLEGQIRLVAADLARASGLAGQELGGRVELVLDALGSFTEPRFTLSLDAADVSADALTVGEVDLAFTADLLAPLDQPFAGVSVDGGGTVGGLTQGGEPLRPENGVSLDLAATLPMEGEARIERLTLEGEHVALNATANVMMPELAGTARLTGRVPSIEALLAALGPDAPADLAATGSVDLEADVDLAAELSAVTVDLLLRGDGLAGLPQDLDGLVGPSPRLDGRVVLRQGESVAVEGLEVATAALGLTGNLTLGLDEAQALSGQIELSPFALQTLEGLVGQPIEGQVQSSIQLAGTLQEPGVNANLRVDNLFIAGRDFDRIALTAEAGQTAGTYGGNLVLGVEQAGDTLRLSSDFTLDQPQLSLANLRLSGPATDIAGGAEIDLEALLATGTLGGQISDLAALEPWIGQEFGGSVELDATFDGSAGEQDAELQVQANDIAGAFGSLRQARVEASVEDVLNRLGVDATITAGGFAQPEPGGVVLDDATIRVTGDRDLFELAADAEGDLQGPFNLRARARADVLGAAQAVYLDELEGVFQAQSILLQSPATMRLKDGVLDIDQLDLRIGDARIQGNLNLDQPRDRAQAGLVIDEFPMTMLAEFGGPNFKGDLEGRIDLEGPLAAPVVTGAIEIAGLQLAAPDHSADRPADITLELRLDNAGLVTATRIEGLGDAPLAADFAMPMRLSLQPFAVDIAETAPLDGRLAGQTRLEPLVAFAALDGQQIEGALDLDLRLGGTVARPVASGALEISNGRVTDALSGIILTDVAVRLVGDGERLEIERFEARDQAGGRLELTGGMAIDPDAAFPYRFELATRELRVLDSDLGRAAVTVDMLMEGSARGGKTSGTITVPRADLRIPSGGGIQPAALDVEVRGAPPPPPPPPPATGERYAMLLDLEVAMPARIFVRGRGLDSEWGGNLEITGSTREPSIEGSIDYRRGFLDFLDRRFEIREGSISFTGGTPPAPTVYLEAAATTRTMTGIVRVTGPVDDLEFALASEPELPQDEVLSQLLFDRGTSGLTPIQGLRLASAVATLEGGGLDAMGALRDITGLDVVDLGNAEFGDEDAETTATAGQYVADNVFIAVDQGLSTGTSRARVEIEVLPNITVRGQVDNDSRSEVGVEWRMDY